MTTPTAVFDPLADAYARYAQLTAEVYTPWLHRALRRVSTARAVDLGCGSGRWSPLLAQHAGQVLAVDASAAQVRLAQRMRPDPAVRYEHRGILDVTPDEDGLFGLVFSVNALFCLYRLHPPDLVFRHVRDLVAPGGTLVLVDVVLPAHRSPLWHRVWGVQDAAETLLRRRSLADARAVHRLRQSRAWMRHVLTALPLTRQAFHQHAADHFPGATVSDDVDRHLAALHWRRPWR